MLKVGCTSPFGPNKTNICTDPEKARIANEIFAKIAYGNLTAKVAKCPQSCTKVFSNIESYNAAKGIGGLLDIRFPRTVKVLRSRNVYGWLELLAEVGGYVGLFLGISINQISSFVQKGFL